jgi:hypothetical protein
MSLNEGGLCREEGEEEEDFMAGAHSVKIQGGAFSLRKSARKELFDTILI